MVIGSILLVTPMLAVALAACGGEDPIDRSRVLFRSAGVTVTVADLEREFATDSEAVRERFNASPEARKDYVERLIRERLLFAEARRRRIDQDPAVKRRYRAMVTAILLREVHEKARAAPVADAEIARRFGQEETTFTSPPVTRLAKVVLASKARADELIAALGRSEKTGEALSALVREHTVDEETRPFAGDLGYLRPNDPRVPASLGAVVQKLENIGDHTPPAAIDGRWVVFVKTGGRPAVKRSLDHASAHIRLQIRTERREQAVDALIDGLRGGAKLDEKLLMQMSVSVEGKGGTR